MSPVSRFSLGLVVRSAVCRPTSWARHRRHGLSPESRAMFAPLQNLPDRWQPRRWSRRPKGLMLTVSIAVSFSSWPAMSEEVPDQLHAAKLGIRATLLGAAKWAYESGQLPNKPDPHDARVKLNRGTVWFSEKDGKLVGHIDNGHKCESEVALRPDGFDMVACSSGEKHFIRSGDEFKATIGSYTYAIRSTP